MTNQYRREIENGRTLAEAEGDLVELGEGGAAIGQTLLEGVASNPREARMRVLTLRAVRAYSRGIREFAAVCEQIAVELGDDESTRRQFAAGLKAALAG